MSLPPLLLERLKRRKIIQETSTAIAQKEEKVDDNAKPKVVDNISSSSCNRLSSSFQIEGQEEIFAEDHSDEKQTIDTSTPQAQIKLDTLESISGVNSSYTESRSEQSCVQPSQNSGIQSPIVDDKKSITLCTTSIIGCPNKYNIYHNCNQFCIDNFSEPKSLTPTLEQQKQLALILKAYPITDDWKVVFDPGVNTFYFWNVLSNLVSWYPPALGGYISPSADEIRKSVMTTESSII